MKNVYITNADRAYCIAMVRIAQIDKLLFFRPAFVLPVLERYFYSRFHGSRTII